jgi:hypothetical protein
MKIRKVIFGISPDETRFSKRGFKAASSEIQEYLEKIGETFVYGYNTALEDQTDSLTKKLDTQAHELRGFAYEGAAMALTILDFVSPWHRQRLNQFIQGAGSHHIYMLYVGVGWAWARLHRNVNKAVTSLDDPLLAWLAVDGYGFHEGYFNWQKTVTKKLVPRHLSAYAGSVFDQGLGRSLWFVKGADVEVIVDTINSFPVERRANLWCGIGLAAAYAGGVDTAALKYLAEFGNIPQLAQGAAFAAKARERAANPTIHTEQACQIFCQSDAITAANVTDESLTSSSSSYKLWQQRIQNHYQQEIKI